jgi:hypothetical protein
MYPPYGKLVDGDGDGNNLNFNNIEDARNHPETKKIRKDMMNGKKPSACNFCWTEESAGITSKRLHMLKKYDINEVLKNTSDDGTIDTDTVPLIYIDLRLGNLCNLKCRVCGPYSSSLWVDDYAELNQIDNKATMNYWGEKEYNLIKTWKIDSADFNWYDDQNFHSWLDSKILNGLLSIYFTGGEPTVNKAHMQILERIIELQKASVISLEYNTNMVAIPPKLLELWKPFKLVNIGASIDAMGPLAAYVRNPSNWEKIEKNIDKIGYNQFSNLNIGCQTTVSILNIRHLIDLSKWLFSKNYTSFKNKWLSWHILVLPEHFSIQVLPSETKKIIEEEFNNFYSWVETNVGNEDGKFIRTNYGKIISFMNQQQKQHLLPKLATTITEIDNLRKENIRTAIPWLSDILGLIPEGSV